MANHDDAARKKALEAAIAHIEKQFGEGSIMTLGKHSAEKEISQAMKRSHRQGE